MISRTSMDVNRNCWKIGDRTKGFYIDAKGSIDEIGGGDESDASGACANEENAEKSHGSWSETPDILLEEIFSYLTMRERHHASMVCKSWHRAFTLPGVWRRFVLGDETLTRGKFNYYSGWQYVLDHIRASTCLNKVGRNFRSLVFEPMLNFHNLYEFMNMITWYAENRVAGGGANFSGHAGQIGARIRHLKFTFPCNMANRDHPEGVRLFGTGGKLLEALKRLTANLRDLRSLEFIDLMLDSREALYLLDDLCSNCGLILRKLVLINATKYHCPLLHIGVFLNLQVLVVSPQNIDEDVLELLGYTKLKHLHIFQNRYSPIDSSIQLPRSDAWSNMRKKNPHIRVHFEIESNKLTNNGLMLPIDVSEESCVPCASIVLDNPAMQIARTTISLFGGHFASSLRVFATKGLTRYYQHKNFARRIDESLVALCQVCPNLHTLMIREKISTATILQIVTTAKSLKCLYVRRNVVLKRCDKYWTEMSNCTAEKVHWLKTHSCSYESAEKAVSQIFGYRWRMLSEKEFKDQRLNLHV